MMDNLIKEFASNEGLFSLWAAIATIIVFLFILYLFSRIRSSSKNKRSSYIGKHNNSSAAISSGIPYYEPTQVKKAWGEVNGKTNNSNYLFNKRDDQINEKKENTSFTNEEKKTVEDNSENPNIIKHITNDDGTETTEIMFDTKNEISLPASFLPKYEYLETANNGQFRKLLPSDEKCFFRTWEENGIRKFEFHGNVDKALANINAIFDDVCEIEGKQNGATLIDNVEPGILNSQLKVEKPAVIKLT